MNSLYEPEALEPTEEPEDEAQKPRRRWRKPEFRFHGFLEKNAESIRLSAGIFHFIILLLLAPFLQSTLDYTGENGELLFSLSYYIPILVAVVLPLVAALYLRPTSLAFHLVAPALPAALYFALQATTKVAWLVVLVFASLAAPICYQVVVRNAQKEGVERDDSGKARRGAQARERSCKLLYFSVLFTTPALLLVALLGLMIAKPTPAPLPLQSQSLPEDELLLSGMDQVVVSLSAWPTGSGSRNQRKEILERLLKWECVTLPTERVYSIHDKEVTSIFYRGFRTVAAALRTGVDTQSGNEQLRRRIELVCYTARMLKLRELNKDGSEKEKTLRSDAMNYAKHRANLYLDQLNLAE